MSVQKINVFRLWTRFYNKHMERKMSQNVIRFDAWYYFVNLRSVEVPEMGLYLNTMLSVSKVQFV